jgi:hypothetical protein
MRTSQLSLKIILRSLGPLPWVGLTVWCVAALLQEPAFFRTQGLDLAWPAIFGGADVFCLAAVLVWVHSISRIRSYRISSSWVIRTWQVLAVLSVCLVAQAAAVMAGLAVDHLTGFPSPWPDLPSLLLRSLLVWMPLCTLAVSIAPLPKPWLATLTVVGAFLMMASVLPVSLAYASASVDKFVASLLATMGSALSAWSTGHETQPTN